MLLDILNARAETIGADYSVYVTPDLEEVWEEFDSEAREALEELGFDVELFDADEPRGYDLATIVYHTITGAGVGLWEPDFASYWEGGEIMALSLRKKLSEWADHTGAGQLNEALTECVGSQLPPIALNVEVNGKDAINFDGAELNEDVTLALIANEEGDQPQSVPLGWLNSARIHAEPDQDRVTVMISVGDPRGAFCMTVERVNGELRLSVPHPDESLPHAQLSPLASPGYYKVGG